MPLVRAGKVKGLAVTTARRMAALPDVAAFAETVPDFEITGWNGFLAPARTPPEIVQKLNQELRAIVDMPDVKQRLVGFGIEPTTTSPVEMAEMIRRESAQWARVIRRAGIKPE